MTDLPQTFTAPPAERRPISSLAVVSLILAAVTAFCFMSVKILVVALSASYTSTSNGVATAFGVLGLLSIVLIIPTIVLGHLALRKSTSHFRARVLAAVALGAGYLFFALYVNRLIVSLIAVITSPHGGTFVQDNYYWL